MKQLKELRDKWGEKKFYASLLKLGYKTIAAVPERDEKRVIEKCTALLEGRAL